VRQFSSITLLSFLFTYFVLQEGLFAKKLLYTYPNAIMKSIDLKSCTEIGRSKQIIEKLGLDELKPKKQISNPYAEAAERKRNAENIKSTATEQATLSPRERHLRQQHEDAKRYQTNTQSLHQNALRHSSEQIRGTIQRMERQNFALPGNR
jgi:hypothetical protein